MNSSFVSIATSVKSTKCLINVLMNISSDVLRDYLECGNIYKSASSKK